MRRPWEPGGAPSRESRGARPVRFASCPGESAGTLRSGGGDGLRDPEEGASGSVGSWEHISLRGAVGGGHGSHGGVLVELCAQERSVMLGWRSLRTHGINLGCAAHVDESQR